MKLFIAFALVAAVAAQISNEYLPPVNSAVSSHDVAASAPAPEVVYAAQSSDTYDVTPAHSFSDTDGYRYKTHRRRIVKTARRNRRDVSLEYLPPVASPAASYTAPSASYSAPATSYTAPAASVESYDIESSVPAHSFSDADGYRYKTQRRRVVKTVRRNRRDVSLEYLPPVASPAASYAAPATSYSAPAASVESYDIQSSAPAHSFSDADGYRYKTQRRRVVKTVRRNRRDVSLEYLPPVASSVASYAVPASPNSAPAASVESYDIESSAPAHSFSDADGYRYKTQRRRVVKTVRRNRRDVSLEYLPPVASAAASYAAPASPNSVPAASVESYDVESSAPAHSFSDADGYRYKTQRRRVVKTVRRNRRDVSLEYLPPVASPAASYAAPAPAASVESYDVESSAPAHSFSDADGYRYKTQRRRVVVRRNRF